MAAWLGSVASLVQTGYQIYQGATGGGDVGRGGSVGPTIGSGTSLIPSVTPATLPSVAVGPLMQGARAMLPRIMTSLGALSRSAAGRRLWRLSRFIGIQAAAAALGLALADALGLMAEATPTTRRRRGISARDLRVTRRTNRRLICAAQDMRELCGTSTVRRARRRSVCS